jgi:HD-like signal output (HDOD) protein
MFTPDLKMKLAVLEGIPTLPIFVWKLVHIIEEDEFTVGDLARIIRQDPAISSRLLKVANSSFFGFSGQVGTLDRAIKLLGTNFIRALALTMATIDSFSQNQGITRTEWYDFWLHSFACAWVANRLIQHGLFSDVGDEAFLSGLLHDLGKPVLWVYEADSYREVKAKMRNNDLSAHAAERAIFGVHHGHVGGELALHWKFPPNIQVAILKHHEAQPSVSAACLVKVSDSIAHSVRSTSPCQKEDGIPLGTITKAFSIKPSILENVEKELQLRGHEIRQLAGTFLRTEG